MSNSNSRRDFIKKSAVVSSVFAVGGVLPGFSAESYKRIIGANDTLRASVMGVNSRGTALAKNFAFQKECDVIHICDVDSRAMEKCISKVHEIQELHLPIYHAICYELEKVFFSDIELAEHIAYE